MGAESHELYRQEILPSVRDFLFGAGPGGCGYLRVPPDTANHWFRHGGAFRKADASKKTAGKSRPDVFEITLASPGIELFLSPHGAGVLSLAFEAEAAEDLRYLQELNYRLSQIRSYTSFVFQLPHTEHHPDPPPTPDAPLTQRLGHAGGPFRLSELAAFLLSPLQPLGYEAMQDQFSVYSVTRFGARADFSEPGPSAALHPFLAALAHVEECAHPGSLSIPELMLNPRHWAATGSLAAVHLVADQAPPLAFDEQRVPIVFYKYFVPFLVTLLQRVALQRLLGEARLALAETSASKPGANGIGQVDADQVRPGARLAARLRELNGHALAFTVNGCFTEISVREAHNQYYELTQTGMRVRDSFGTVQQALRDAEAMDNDRFQGETLREIGKVADDLQALVSEAGNNARLVAHVQSKVEWLEVFFVSYYFTALMYYVNHGGSLFSHDYSLWTMVAAPVVSGLIAFIGLKPHRLRRASGQEDRDRLRAPHSAPGAAKHKERTWWFLLLLIAAFVLWLGVGLRFFPHSEGHQSHGKHGALIHNGARVPENPDHAAATSGHGAPPRIEATPAQRADNHQDAAPEDHAADSNDASSPPGDAKRSSDG